MVVDGGRASRAPPTPQTTSPENRPGGTAACAWYRRLGCVLTSVSCSIERTTRSVTLTTEGAAWLPYAREALHAADRAAEAAEDLAAGRVGRFRLGLAATAGVDVTPRMLRAFAERFPLVELAIEHFDFRDPSGGLRDRRSDVAIVRLPFEEDGLELVAIGTEAHFAVLPTDHPLADRAAVDFVEVMPTVAATGRIRTPVDSGP